MHDNEQKEWKKTVGLYKNFTIWKKHTNLVYKNSKQTYFWKLGNKDRMTNVLPNKIKKIAVWVLKLLGEQTSD